MARLEQEARVFRKQTLPGIAQHIEMIRQVIDAMPSGGYVEIPIDSEDMAPEYIKHKQQLIGEEKLIQSSLPRRMVT